MGAGQVGLFDETDLDLERGGEHDERGRGRVDRGPTGRLPVAMSMAVKIGLRTFANTPVVTRSVRWLSSAPMRHESPMASWATRVSAMPPTPSTAPATAAHPTSSVAMRAMPAASAIGAATSSPRAATNPTDPASSAIPPRRARMNPVEAVRRHCTQDRHPNADAKNTTSKPTAIHVRVTGRPRRGGGG